MISKNYIAGSDYRSEESDSKNRKLHYSRTNKLFQNADDDGLFDGVANVKIVSPYHEIRKEESPINPFDFLEQGNRERDEVRKLAALGNENEILVKGPSAVPVQITQNPLVQRNSVNAMLRPKKRT